jgi:hypothetical protein
MGFPSSPKREEKRFLEIKKSFNPSNQGYFFVFLAY